MSDKRVNNLPQLLLTPRETARTLGISDRTLWGLPDLPRIRIGRSVRYSLDDIKEWIARRRNNQ